MWHPNWVKRESVFIWECATIPKVLNKKKNPVFLTCLQFENISIFKLEAVNFIDTISNTIKILKFQITIFFHIRSKSTKNIWLIEKFIDQSYELKLPVFFNYHSDVSKTVCKNTKKKAFHFLTLLWPLFTPYFFYPSLLSLELALNIHKNHDWISGVPAITKKNTIWVIHTFFGEI